MSWNVLFIIIVITSYHHQRRYDTRGYERDIDTAMIPVFDHLQWIQFVAYHEHEQH
jgi:hypothetical protein